MIDYEVELLKLYTNPDSIRRLIDLGLKYENVEIFTEEAAQIWREVKDWYQKTGGKVIPLEVLMEDHEQYIKLAQEGQEDSEPLEPSWIVTKIQTKYLHSIFKKRVIDSQKDGTFDANDDYLTSLEKAKEFTRDLMRITVTSTSERPLEPMSDRMSEFVEDTLSWEDRLQDGEIKPPVTFGFKMVDDAYKGMRPGELAVVAAGWKVGKSYVACKQALKAAQDGRKVALWTLENSEEMAFARLCALAGGFSMSHISDKTLPPNQRDRFKALVGEEVFERIYVKQPMASHDRSLEEIYWQSYNVGVELVIGDQYSHVTYSGRKGDPDWLIEGEKALESRRLSLDSGLPSIWMTQLNRGGGKKSSPDGSDIGRSIGIVQAADWMFYLSKPQNGIDARRLHCSDARRGPEMDWEMLFKFDPMTVEVVRVITI